MAFNEPSLFVPENGGDFELEIIDNSPFNIALKGNPTTGYSWYLDNAEEIKTSNIIEPLNIDEHNGSKDYVSDPTSEPMCGVGGKSIFKFKVNNGSGKELPILKLVYVRPWEKDVPPSSEANIVLKLNNGSSNIKIDNFITLPQDVTESEIKVKEGEVFSIRIKGNPTTGYSWFLINEEELNKTGVIPLNLTEHKSGDYISHNPKGMVGGGGVFDFQFKVEKMTNNLPSIQFTYRRPWLPVDENDRKLIVAIKPE